MNASLIYSATGKGLVELKTGADNLSALQARVLRLLDGKASIAVISAHLGEIADGRQLEQTIADLERLELATLLAPAIDDETSDLGDIQVVELSPMDSVQAWAEAQRGARELAEKGYYSPVGTLHHARHEAGDGINRVLIVEDDNTTAKVLEFLLAEHDFQTVRAANAEGAFTELQRHPLPDVVLLDVQLPDVDGFAILRHIRATPELRDLPVIMVTALISDEDVLRGLKEGADGYIFKPFRWQTLHACIEKVL